jgi:hypothetical protein
MINQLPKLNLPSYHFNIKENKIFDKMRKKWVVLTPEEWVRQNFITYLAEEKKYPKSLIKVEKSIIAFNKVKRCDSVVYSGEIEPLLILECKSPDIKINEKTFKQIAVYNSSIKAPYLIVTNGMDHYCIKFNFDDNSYNFLNSIPHFKELVK